MASMGWPLRQPAWIVPWSVWRFKGRPLPRPDAPLPIPDWGWEFLRWAEWRIKRQGVPPRPAGLPPIIPQWAWTAVKQIKAELAPKPVPAEFGSWTLPLPILFTAWGFGTGGNWEGPSSLVAFAAQCKQAGVGTVALQIGHAGKREADALKAQGIGVAAWMISSGNDKAELAAMGAQGYIPQIEGPGQNDAAIQALGLEGVGKGLSLAVVTTFAGEDIDGLVAHGCDCAMVECYAPEGGIYADLDRMIWAAHSYGWPHALPVLGIYHGFHLSNYPALPKYGRNFGIWVAETMQPEDWTALGAAR